MHRRHVHRAFHHVGGVLDDVVAVAAFNLVGVIADVLQRHRALDKGSVKLREALADRIADCRVHRARLHAGVVVVGFRQRVPVLTFRQRRQHFVRFGGDVRQRLRLRVRQLLLKERALRLRFGNRHSRGSHRLVEAFLERGHGAFNLHGRGGRFGGGLERHSDLIRQLVHVRHAQLRHHVGGVVLLGNHVVQRGLDVGHQRGIFVAVLNQNLLDVAVARRAIVDRRAVEHRLAIRGQVGFVGGLRRFNLAVEVRNDFVLRHGHVLHRVIFRLGDEQGFGHALADNFLRVADFIQLGVDFVQLRFEVKGELGRRALAQRIQLRRGILFNLRLFFVRQLVKPQLLRLRQQHRTLDKAVKHVVGEAVHYVRIGAVERQAVPGIQGGHIVDLILNLRLHLCLGIGIITHADDHARGIDRFVLDNQRATAENHREHQQQCQQSLFLHKLILSHLYTFH